MANNREDRRVDVSNVGLDRERLLEEMEMHRQDLVRKSDALMQWFNPYLPDMLRDRVNELAKLANNRPMQAVLGALAVGFFLGRWARRRSSRRRVA